MITIGSRSNFLSFLTGSSTHTWQPIKTADTATLSYWLNWRFSLCALFVLTSMVVAAIIIWKFEGRKSEHQEGENLKEAPRPLYEDETWNTCLKGIHPAWLLSFRVFAFFMLLVFLVAYVVIDGAGIFYFYTQWTFILVAIYFGFGSVVSIYGYQNQWGKVGGNKADCISFDSEQGTYLPPTVGETANASSHSKHFDAHEAPYHPTRAAALAYAFQIIYQTCAGAVMLTDSVFWLILFPFLTSKDYSLNFLIVCMHSINAVFLLGDTILNCMPFPLFRIAYFVLWTDTFVIFQWIIHACVNLWWPYPFLDLSSSFAPLWFLKAMDPVTNWGASAVGALLLHWPAPKWGITERLYLRYSGVGLMQIPCYVIFSLIMKLKDFSLSRSFPDSYRKSR